MTSPKGKSEFRLPETHNVYRGEEEGSIEVEGEQNCFPRDKSVSVLLYLSTQN